MSQVVRVALDVHALQVEGYADRGIGRYVSGYARALHRRGALAAALLAGELPPASGLPGELVESGSVRWDSQEACRSLLLEAGGAGQCLAYHVTAPFLHCGPAEPASLGVVEHWARSGVPRVVLLHDLIPLRAPHHYLPSRVHQERYRARAEWVGAADLILTNSDYTRREAIDLLEAPPASVVSVGAGVSRYFSPPDGTDEELFRFRFEPLVARPFVLTVGGSDLRKGTDRAIDAFARVLRGGADMDLVVAGHLTSTFRSDLEAAARACGVGGRVHFAGAIDDELLRALYRRAVVSIMPSLAEGAGLPVLESARCGTPALASGTTALAESAATPEACFDPTDIDSIADALASTVRDAGRRARILSAQQAAAASSTWETVAERSLEALDRLLVAPGRTTPRIGAGAPLRVALVGELPAPVAGDLARRAEVTLVGQGLAAVSPAAFGPDVRPASFDLVVYGLRSGSGGRTDVVRLARRYPGWLWVDRTCMADNGDELAELVRSCRGLIVEPADQRRLELVLDRSLPRPPVVVVAPGPGDPLGTAGLLEVVSATPGPD